MLQAGFQFSHCSDQHTAHSSFPWAFQVLGVTVESDAAGQDAQRTDSEWRSFCHLTATSFLPASGAFAGVVLFAKPLFYITRHILPSPFPSGDHGKSPTSSVWAPLPFSRAAPVSAQAGPAPLTRSRARSPAWPGGPAWPGRPSRAGSRAHRTGSCPRARRARRDRRLRGTAVPPPPPPRTRGPSAGP